MSTTPRTGSGHTAGRERHAPAVPAEGVQAAKSERTCPPPVLRAHRGRDRVIRQQRRAAAGTPTCRAATQREMPISPPSNANRQVEKPGARPPRAVGPRTARRPCPRVRRRLQVPSSSATITTATAPARGVVRGTPGPAAVPDRDRPTALAASTICVRGSVPAGSAPPPVPRPRPGVAPVRPRPRPASHRPKPAAPPGVRRAVAVPAFRCRCRCRNGTRGNRPPPRSPPPRPTQHPAAARPCLLTIARRRPRHQHRQHGDRVSRAVGVSG